MRVCLCTTERDQDTVHAALHICSENRDANRELLMLAQNTCDTRWAGGLRTFVDGDPAGALGQQHVQRAIFSVLQDDQHGSLTAVVYGKAFQFIQEPSRSFQPLQVFPNATVHLSLLRPYSASA